MARFNTAKEEGYAFHRRDGAGAVIFLNIAEGTYERFGANKNHASWGFRWGNTHWEFLSTVGNVKEGIKTS